MSLQISATGRRNESSSGSSKIGISTSISSSGTSGSAFVGAAWTGSGFCGIGGGGTCTAFLGGLSNKLGAKPLKIKIQNIGPCHSISDVQHTCIMKTTLRSDIIVIVNQYTVQFFMTFNR